jgi:hypothetical protein
MHSSIDIRPPWIVLVAAVLITSIESLAFAVLDVAPPKGTQGLWTVVMNSAWSWWVFVDRRRRGISYPFEFDALVFFLWPVVVPYYLLQSRAGRSRANTVFIWLAFSAPFLLAAALYISYS